MFFRWAEKRGPSLVRAETVYVDDRVDEVKPGILIDMS
jgi:hypothetical protein